MKTPYSFSKKLGNSKIKITFKTLEEMIDYVSLESGFVGGVELQPIQEQETAIKVSMEPATGV